MFIEHKIINFVETLHKYFDPRNNCLVGSWHIFVVVVISRKKAKNQSKCYHR